MGFFDAPKPKKEKRKSYYLVPTDEKVEQVEETDDEFEGEEY